MTRGDVRPARLDPAEGSEQAGVRPVVVVSRDAINAASPVVIVVPCMTRRRGRRLYPSHVLLSAPEGGLKADSVALAEQVHAIAITRLGPVWGSLSPASLRRLERALLIAMDLPGQ